MKKLITIAALLTCSAAHAQTVTAIWDQCEARAESYAARQHDPAQRLQTRYDEHWDCLDRHSLTLVYDAFCQTWRGAHVASGVVPPARCWKELVR